MKDWKDLGNGQWKLTVTVDGDPTAQPSVFRGTRDEIADKLADSQANANRRLSELRRTNGTATATPSPTAPRQLSAAERLETVADLQNPANVDRGVTRIIESVMGPVAELQRDRAAEREQERTRKAIEAAETFVEQTPEWNPSEFNKQTLANYLKAQGLDPTNPASYSQAFEALSAAQLLQPKTSEDETNNEPGADEGRNAPTPTQQRRTVTRYSTSVRSSDISGRPPVPGGKPHLKYTREQLENLSASDYKRLMQTDRAEMERCEAYYASRTNQQARRTG